MTSPDEDNSELEVFDRSLTQSELEDLIEPDESPVAVTFSTQDFDVSGLVKRLNRKSMIVPSFGTDDSSIATAGFQRGFVWSKTQMDRFIESLLLGYPVPGIFLVKQITDNRMLVLDGQQRLVTLQRFYNGMHNGREFTLENVGVDFKGVTYASMDESLQYKIDDSYLQATIVIADGSKPVNEAVYQIFERLNSGGTQLTPHEIRAALYAGPLIAYLEVLNRSVAWRSLYGKPSARIRDQELILRILALYVDVDNYSRPLKTFLNQFADDHRDLDEAVRSAGAIFEQACSLILSGPGVRAFRRPGVSQVNVAQTEAVMVGLMHALREASVTSNLESALSSLLNNDNFVAATTRATADNDSVAERVRLSREAFSAK